MSPRKKAETSARRPPVKNLAGEMKPLFFPSPPDWHAWLEQHHAKHQELWVGFHKKDSCKPSITWPEAVDGALCFGWIDGVRRSLNENSYVIRLASIWQKNIIELSFIRFRARSLFPLQYPQIEVPEDAHESALSPSPVFRELLLLARQVCPVRPLDSSDIDEPETRQETSGLYHTVPNMRVENPFDSMSRSHQLFL